MVNIIKEAENVFDTEITELQRVKESLDESFVDIVNVVNECKGKVIICGMGKPGHIAHKISATMSSLGIHSYVLHPAEAMHGDLGTLSKSDIIIFISNSGESEEICRILPNVKMLEIPIIGITSNGSSTLAKYSDYLLKLPEFNEACFLKLAPTSSTTAALVIGDAIAVIVSKMREFKKNRFALYHPAGSLGKKLTVKVDDIMLKGANLPIVHTGVPLKEAIVEMCRIGSGAVVVSDTFSKLIGIITDGDLRRFLEKNESIEEMIADDLMSPNPIGISTNELAVEALRIMENREKSLSVLPVLDENGIVIGLVTNHDIIKQGIFM